MHHEYTCADWQLSYADWVMSRDIGNNLVPVSFWMPVDRYFGKTICNISGPALFAQIKTIFQYRKPSFYKKFYRLPLQYKLKYSILIVPLLYDNPWADPEGDRGSGPNLKDHKN